MSNHNLPWVLISFDSQTRRVHDSKGQWVGDFRDHETARLVVYLANTEAVPPTVTNPEPISTGHLPGGPL